MRRSGTSSGCCIRRVLIDPNSLRRLPAECKIPTHTIVLLPCFLLVVYLRFFFVAAVTAATAATMRNSRIIAALLSPVCACVFLLTTSSPSPLMVTDIVEQTFVLLTASVTVATILACPRDCVFSKEPFDAVFVSVVASSYVATTEYVNGVVSSEFLQS